MNACNVCKTSTGKKCARCKNAYYCSKACQTSDWKHHKTSCNIPYKELLESFSFTLEMDIEKWNHPVFKLNEQAVKGAKLREMKIGSISYYGEDDNNIDDVEKDSPEMLNEIVYPEKEITFDSKFEAMKTGMYQSELMKLNPPSMFGRQIDLRDSMRTEFTRKTFRSENGFTVRKLIDCVFEFEKEDRPKTMWMGGVDCHHRFFEGLRLNADKKSYTIDWGS